jgi:uncharacterized protein YndB with AHSA1/START domain
LPSSTDSTPDAIVQSVVVRAHRSRVWRAITTAAEFSQWFRVSVQDEFRAGTRVHLTSNYPGHEGTEFFIDIEDIEPERRFSWRWMPVGKKGDPPSAEDHPTLVVFELADVPEGGTRITVTESGFNRLSLARRAAAFESNTKGWQLQMANIRNHVEQAAA